MNTVTLRRKKKKTFKSILKKIKVPKKTVPLTNTNERALKMKNKGNESTWKYFLPQNLNEK